MRVIGITNEKGGVGKTTTAIAFSTLFADQGQRTLLVDFDGQGNATASLRKSDAGAMQAFSAALAANTPVGRLARKVAPDLSIVRNGGDFGDGPDDENSFADRLNRLRDTLGVRGATSSLRRLLESGAELFDVVVIDSGPTSGLIRQMLLHACDELVVPLELEQPCMEGLSELTGALEIALRNGAQLRLTGILPVCVNSRLALSNKMHDNLGDLYSGYAMRTYVRQDAALPKAWASGRLRTFTSRTTSAAKDYRDAFVELCNRMDDQMEAAE